MRPTVAELLLRLEQTFNTVIVPEVQSEYAKTRAVVLSGLISHLRTRVDLEEEVLTGQEADLAVFLETAAAALSGRTGDEALAADLRTFTTAAPATTLAARQARCRDGMALCETLVDRLDGATGDLAPLRDELHALLRRLIDRDMQLVQAPQHGARGVEAGLDDVLRD